MSTQTNIEAGQVLKARSACDYEVVFVAEVVARKGSFVTVRVNGAAETKRVKVRAAYDGGEFIFAMGQYSMAPIFRA